MKAVIFAGGYAAPDLTAVAGSDRKGLIELGGRPTITYVLDAVRQSKTVREVVLVGARELQLFAKEFGAEFLPESDGAIANILLGMEALGVKGSDERLMTLPGDTPLLRPEDIESFAARLPEEAGVGMTFVPRAAAEREHPGGPYTYIRIREGEFATGSLGILRASTAERISHHLQAMIASRKSQLKVAMQLGLWTLVRFRTGRLSIEHAQRKVEQLVDDAAFGDLAASPRTALDLDTEEDYLYIRDNWERLCAL
jgi:molybdopterin-guanine dinucleotide biosynthesis protein A